MRVLQINSIFNGGGVDNQTLELCQGLLALGDEVTLAVPPGKRCEPLARAMPGLDLRLVDGAKLHWAWSLRRIVRERRIQIVQAHHGRDYWVACAAARLGGLRGGVVLSRHLMTPLSATSARYLLRLAHVVAVSRAVQAVLEPAMRGPRQRLHLIYGGVDTVRYSPAHAAAAGGLRRELGWDADCVVFAVVGSMHGPRGKGQLEFLEAAGRVHAALPQARFLVSGHGSLSAEIGRRAASMGLDGVFKVLPFQDDVLPVHAASDVAVLPAIGSEALGLVLWEAMACGKPVIASRLDGIPEAFVEGEHGLLVPPGDAAALAAAMLALGADAGLRQRMGAAAAAYVAGNFSSRLYAQRMHELYRAVAVDA